MSLVALFDLVEFAAVLAAFVFVSRGWNRVLHRDAKLVLLGLLTLSLFHSSSNVLEWSGLTSYTDAFEDYLEILTPMLWAGFFYVFLREIAERELRNAEKELRSTYRELEKQNVELKKLDLMKEGLLRDVSHELKTPVAKHSMQLQILKPLLRAHSLTENEEKAFSVMEESVRRQEQVIRNLLNLSRLESGGREYRRNPVELEGLFRTVISEFQHAIESYGIEIVSSVDSITVASDEEMLWHVFSNILNNAIKFRKKAGQARITISAEPREGEVHVRVADNGIGIETDKLNDVFKRFYQIAAANEGCGVGLTICRQIVEDLGGQISVESEGGGKGAAVVVSLPKGEKGEERGPG